MSDDTTPIVPVGYTVRPGIAGAEPAGWLVIRDNGQLLLNGERVFDEEEQATQFLTDYLADLPS